MIIIKSHNEIFKSSNVTSKIQLFSFDFTNKNKAITKNFTLKNQNINLKNQLIVVKLIVLTMQQTIEIKNSSNFTIVATIVKSFNDIKIHNDKSNIYYDHERFRYDVYMYQINYVFQINENFETIKESKFYKIIFATLYFQKNVLNG